MFRGIAEGVYIVLDSHNQKKKKINQITKSNKTHVNLNREEIDGNTQGHRNILPFWIYRATIVSGSIRLKSYQPDSGESYFP